MERRQSGTVRADAIEAEQSYVSMLYTRLDTVRDRTDQALRSVQARGASGTRQATVEREVSAGEHARRLSQLSAVERGLCFGRIDDSSGTTLYIGRIGLRDDDHESLLIDWRAPVARPFYVATPGDSGTLVRRRHLHIRNRTVVDIDDEVFDLDQMSESDRRTLVGEAALLAALRRGRTGRMGEVVATIQIEQDRVIRSGLPGVLVVQGGPGTGKTVAALHRAAYLLYAHRSTLERRGVLVIGPNSLFSRYIGQVLPSLGETEVVLSSVGELHAGLHATEEDGPAAAVVKGDLRMAEVVEAAVRDRQCVPDGDLEVAIPIRTSLRGGVEVVVEEMTLRVDHASCVRARERARDLRRPHNLARHTFVGQVLRGLARDEARQLDLPMDEEDPRYAAKVLWRHQAVREAVERLWPRLTPERLVSELLSDEDLLRSAATPYLSDPEIAALLRPRGAAWTVGDVPLLDEAAELLGEDDTEERARAVLAEKERREEELYAREVLEITDLAELMEESADPAAFVAERHRDGGPYVTTAQRAARDRHWAYGHVIVDEAQELSAMAWRVVMRRVPSRSLTVVGDIAQTGSAAGARSWGEMLDRYVKGRWREERLLVNYRTPAEIMAVAADVLKTVAPDQEPPKSVRYGEAPPRALRAAETGLRTLVESELAAIGEGRVAVVTPDVRHAEIAAMFPETPDPLDSVVAVLTVSRCKGLEFDAVVVADPGGILAQSPKGGQDLYVAITRATRRLTVVHEAELPEMLARLA
ncbi:ATP-binding domain-containing protein [Planotetraspora sp. A-T 1434]|uniref:HelD family protein n=1 Tax=Planotetraspora sp. A-T 1434 TaxID=2979219 RepID=UPI0021C15C06|nr:ATP-binding domain-containing protein [Planotetraspora sp. A-T 1434]MCT9931778.1 ATP-binding domain-containing protein [Planotetraspora sp. A-T 1434]